MPTLRWIREATYSQLYGSGFDDGNGQSGAGIT